MALACSIVTFESTVFENTFHEDHPIGGGGTAICLGTLSVIRLAGHNKTAPTTAKNDASVTGIAFPTLCFRITPP
jgi:hypothetical protein